MQQQQQEEEGPMIAHRSAFDTIPCPPPFVEALSFPGGEVAVRKPTKTELTVTARHWLKLAIASGAHVDRDLQQGWDLAIGEDFAAMRRAVEMALAALEEAK